MLLLFRIGLFQNDALGCSLLHLFDDFLSTGSSADEFLLNLGLLGFCKSLLVVLDLLSLLLMLLILCLGLLLDVVSDRRGSSHLTFDLCLLDLEFALEFFSLALDGLLNFLIVLLGLLLDSVELLDVALLCDLVPLCCLSQELFFLSPLVGGLAFSDKLDLVVVGLGLLLNAGDRSFPVHLSSLELFTEFGDGLLSLSTLIGGPALTVEFNFCRGLLDLR